MPAVTWLTSDRAGRGSLLCLLGQYFFHRPAARPQPPVPAAIKVSEAATGPFSNHEKKFI